MNCSNNCYGYEWRGLKRKSCHFQSVQRALSEFMKLKAFFDGCKSHFLEAGWFIKMEEFPYDPHPGIEKVIFI